MKVVNQPLRKKDAMQLVTGQPVYVDDVTPRDCLCVKLLRSPHANAIVKSINKTAAMKVPGMEAIFTWEDVDQDGRRYTQAGQTYPEASPYDRLVIDRHVRFVGDVVAILAGADEKCVDKAMKLVKVEYEVLEPVLDFHTAKDNPVLVHPEDNWESLAPVGADNKRNLCAHDECGNGDIDAVLADCDVVIDRVYHTQACQQAMMETFRTYCESYPTNAVLLVDTYNTLKSGIPNAIRAFNDVLKPMGITKCGIRLDSGDMSYLTKEARRMLDEAGWESCTITCSNSLDEYIIQDLLLQGACIDSFGVGERLITAKSEPVFGGVYKLVAVERESGEVVPKIKVSENVAKITIPHFKKFFRFYDRTNGKALADYLCLYDETPDDTQPLTIFHPENTWKRKTLTNFRAENMMVPVFRAGELVYDLPSLKDIRKRCAEQLETLWPEVLRFENPHGYYVDLSNRLWDIRHDLLVNAGHSQIPEKQ